MEQTQVLSLWKKQLTKVSTIQRADYTFSCAKVLATVKLILKLTSLLNQENSTKDQGDRVRQRKVKAYTYDYQFIQLSLVQQ